MLDIVIKNGTVFDGLGNPGKKLDVAVSKGKIVDLAVNIKSKAAQTVNAQDRFVAPGFIDIQNHSDSYWTILDQPNQLSLLSQGITTIVMGNCGASLAPLLTPESIKTIQKWHSLNGVNIDWTTLEEFLDYLTLTPLGVNVATLVGHATIRRGILGDLTRVPSADELKILNKALRDALNQGAFGLSLGLIYAHEVNSTFEELQQSAALLKPSNKYLSVHLRSEADHIVESLEEVIDLAAKTSVPVKISHLKIRGKKNSHLFETVLGKIEQAYHQGINISFDVYPYSSSWSVLYTYLPKWAYEGGRTQILKTISDATSRRKVLDYLKNSGQDYGSIIISEASGNANFAGKTIKQIAQNQSLSAEETVLNVLAATNAQVIVFDHNLSDQHVETLCASGLSMIATDGAGYTSRNSDNLIHPRCFGTMPRFLKLVREKKLLKIEAALQKITSEPAKLMGLKDRGSLAAGSYADLVVFDPLTVSDNADYINPYLLSDGIDMVMVNGKLSYANKEAQNLNGTVLRR